MATACLYCLHAVAYTDHTVQEGHSVSLLPARTGLHAVDHSIGTKQVQSIPCQGATACLYCLHATACKDRSVQEGHSVSLLPVRTGLHALDQCIGAKALQSVACQVATVCLHCLHAMVCKDRSVQEGHSVSLLPARTGLHAVNHAI